MNISVRVLSASAQAQIKALQAQVAGLQKQLAAANASSASGAFLGGARTRKSLVSFGSQLQWTGRQLQYNFTVPILLAAGAATKFALDNEKAMTRVTKVYGDSDDAQKFYATHNAALTKVMAQNQDAFNKVLADNPGITNEAAAAQVVFKNELDALGDAFEMMSTKYGVAQKDVIETGSAWAAAGVSGVALAKATDLSIRAAILGDLDLAKATESLIAIQSQYSLGTKELNLTLAELNAIENQTGISMGGLIDGFSRAAGTAREAGIDVRHLGAMMAALVPATGSAATAGNALKTIISRLMSPTKDASDVMAQFGVDTTTAAWNSATAMERLEVLAGHMHDTLQKTGTATKDLADDGYQLSDSQRNIVASVLGSRYQMNRFLVLMRELGPEHTYYEKALNATSDNTKVLDTATRELNAVLNSSPQRLKIIWTTIQNGMADAVQPLITYFLWLVGVVGKVMNAFNKLNPELRKLILIFFLSVAILGPVIKYFASLLVMIGTLFRPVVLLGGAFMSLFTRTVILADGTKVARAGFLKLWASWLLAPFGWIKSGIGAVIGWLWRMPLVTRAVAAINTAAWAVIGAGPQIALAAWAAAVAVLRARIPVIWAAMMSRIVVIQSIGFAAILRNWVVSIALMTRYASMGPVVRTFMLAVGLMQTALVGGLGRMLLAVISFGARLDIIWATLWAGLVYIFEAFQIAMLGALTFLRTTFLAGWTGMYLGMTAITAAGGRALAAIQLVGYRALLAITTIGETALTAAMTVAGRARVIVWAAVQTAMRALSIAFWSQVIRIWILGAVGIRNVLFGMQRGIQAAWATIVAIQRTGSIAAVAAAAGPWVALGAALVAVIIIFRKQAIQIWNNIVAYFQDSNNKMIRGIEDAFNSLPQAVSSSMIAVANIIKAAALEIYGWFSYINPFAHHSPSLTDQVKDGTKQIGDNFSFMSNGIKYSTNGAYMSAQKMGKGILNVGTSAESMAAHIKAATSAVAAYNAAAKGSGAKIEDADYRKDKRAVKKYAPGALGEFKNLHAVLQPLKADLDAMDGKVKDQAKVVERWSDKLKVANRELDKQEWTLKLLKDNQDELSKSLDQAQDRLTKWANTPIQGMRAMSDAIFENEMQQKRLRLEMMKMEDVGGTLDDIKSKIEAINGAQELLRGEQTDLRNNGAGSDILSGYDKQIAALEAQKKALTGAAVPIQQMTDDLDKLSREAERLDLEQSLQFDPLTRQIEQASSALDEMPFGTIIANVRDAQTQVSYYTDALAASTAQVDAQQGVVDGLTRARDALSRSYDIENEKLDDLKDKYAEVKDAVDAVKEAMQAASDAAAAMKSIKDAKKAKKGPQDSPAVKNFKSAAGGNFAQVGGAGIPIRDDWSDQQDKIDKFAKQLADQTAGAFGGLNPFEPIKKYWGKFTDWLSGAYAKVKDISSDFFSHMFDGVGVGGGIQKIKDTTNGVINAFQSMYDWIDGHVLKHLRSLWTLFWPDIKKIFTDTWEGIKPTLDEFRHEFDKWGDLLEPAKSAFKGFSNVVKVILGAVFFVVALVGKVILSTVGGMIKPAFETIARVVLNIIQVVRGVIQFLMGFFMLFDPSNWNLQGLQDAFALMGAGLFNILSGTFGAIGQLVWGFIKTVAGAIWGFVSGIYGFFKWLWDELVGHSIVPDMINGIIHWFHVLEPIVMWLWNEVLKPIFNRFVSIAADVIEEVSKWWGRIQTAFALMKLLGSWFWDNVLSPIIEKAKNLWTSISTEFGEWRTRVENVWQNLKDLGGWIKTNVMDPVIKAFKDGWDAVKTYFTDKKDDILSPFKSVVRGIVDLINLMIRGLNQLDKIPGVSISIEEIGIPAWAMAQGGKVPARRVGNGWVTNGARAIVGEGKANYPEYVIPTDPTHRNRARGLLSDAAGKLGMEATPAYGLGGIIGVVKKVAKKGAGALASAGRQAISTAMSPVFGAANKAVDALPNWYVDEKNIPHDAGHGAIDKIKKWVDGTQAAYEDQYDKVQKAAKASQNSSAPFDPGMSPWQRTTFRGKFVDAGQVRSILAAERSLGYALNIIQGSYHSGTQQSAGTHDGGGAVDVSPATFAVQNALRQHGQAAWLRNPSQGDWDYHVHSLMIGDPNLSAAAAQQVADFQNGGDGLANARGGILRTRALKEGGIALASRGPALAAIGDGRYDEAVVPLPKGWRNGVIGSGGGDKTYHFHGDLSFPNITDPNDIDTFISNLESLAKD